ncbi:uncharacterized protein [Ptychodera flava]|uniref:uncharacterized protein n=1 Tax=Ptychodera flava TaxID=63121 RepID=UPI00396AA5A5
MKFTFAIVTILALAYADDSDDKPLHSKPWICTHLVRKSYDNAIMNAMVTPGVDCFEDLLALPDKIKDRTPSKSYPTYMVAGPYIGKSKTFRIVSVVEEEIENVDLGEKMDGKFAVECMKCTVEYYDDGIVVVTCTELTMEECPEQLSGEIYWNPPGEITSSSDAEFCMYRNQNDIYEYICTIFDADIDVS